MNASAPAGWSGQSFFQEAVQGSMDGFGSPGRGREVQGNPDGSGAVEGADRIHTPALWPTPRPYAPRAPNWPTRAGSGREMSLFQGGDAQTLQPLDHEGVHRKDGNGAGGEEGGEVPIGDQDRSARVRPGLPPPRLRIFRRLAPPEWLPPGAGGKSGRGSGEPSSPAGTGGP